MKRILTLALYPVLSTIACDSTGSEAESDSTDTEVERDSTDTEVERDGLRPTLAVGEAEPAASTPLRAKALGRMRNAAKYFHDNVARHGGYAWHHNATNLNERWGDIQLDADQIMIQSPGTADVTIAFVEAALADPATPALKTYARDAAMALRHGQVKSGGWRLYADFKPTPTLKACYLNTTANCSCGGCKFTVYDDQVTQTALIAMMRTDQLLGFADAAISGSSAYARARVETSQFPTHGGFPQGFAGPVAARPALQASYPPSIGTSCGLANCYANLYTTEYWDDPTLNDNLASAFVEMLYWAKEVYPAQAATYGAMLTAYGDFLRRAQMPQPQPAWAQQYDIQMQPRWARSWEAPAIAGQESQDVMWALLRLYQLDPSVPANRDAVGAALAYLETVDHANDTLIHRYIELDDTSPANVGFYTVNPNGYPVQFSPAPPTYQNYGWVVPSQLAAIRAEYDRLASDTTVMKRSCQKLRADTAQAVDTAVNNERWITTYSPGGPRSGATPGDYLDTATFVKNMRTLAEFVVRTTTDCVAWNY
ncbi:Pectic acid lyase [Nannocystis exedens]|uniref:Pectic acid lyase n=1 Tax=Nannocystis exedens TaxID=54 RepID=A0A1I2C232_9BACT|nr:pectate lyase [Nannocystis exedens]PCC71156.1 Pectic acid lyase [Nannocystis exedens]SFE61650.1 Pectic acid lyase [Nannocystis exedens]